MTLLHDTEGIDIEPSAAAGIPGALRLLADTGSAGRRDLADDRLRNDVHTAWVTGGSMVPADELAASVDVGRSRR